MATWPDIQNPSDMTPIPTKGQIKTGFAAGYVQSRAKWTRSRKTFELSWKAMTNADANILEAFFDDNLGGTFTWTHPLSGVSYTVRFAEDKIPFGYVHYNHWKVKLTLEEL